MMQIPASTEDAYDMSMRLAKKHFRRILRGRSGLSGSSGGATRSQKVVEAVVVTIFVKTGDRYLSLLSV